MGAGCASPKSITFFLSLLEAIPVVGEAYDVGSLSLYAITLSVYWLIEVIEFSDAKESKFGYLLLPFVEVHGPLSL